MGWFFLFYSHDAALGKYIRLHLLFYLFTGLLTKWSLCLSFRRRSGVKKLYTFRTQVLNANR